MSDKKETIGKNLKFVPIHSIEYSSGSVVSKQVIKNKAGNVTLFAFDEGEGLSEHTAPFDALVYVLEGNLQIRIGATEHNLSGGDAIIMEANIPHALLALSKIKFILTMIRGEV
jgi:quercetin dioxygenase-like cupin family protein